MRRLRRIAAVAFAGDGRVWKAAALAAVPLVGLIVFYCVRPRFHYTGTNSVEALTYIAETPAGAPMCVPALQIPAGTGRIRLQLISRTRIRPALTMTLRLGGSSPQTIDSVLAPARVPSDRISAPEFSIPRLAARPAERSATLCVRAGGLVNWGGTPLVAVPEPSPPTMDGHPLTGRIAVWYEPPATSSESSYLARLGTILSRASLFRPSPIGPWTYGLILFVLLPGLAFASVRRLALAVAGQGSARCTAAWLFAIAALNFACWALITPPFQAPDEVDHFAYTQSLVERGEAPSRNPGSPLARWSSSETLALEGESFFTDHQVGDSKAPWTARQQGLYRAGAANHPSSADGGGNETAATHGAIYYAALAPAYMLASSSPFSQLTLMRLVSALIGALTVVFAYLMARELAPGRPWLGVLAALLVAYQPMYGFISGAVNNDVGVNAGAAGLELLLILMLRRGVTWRLGLSTGALLVALPIVKGTAYSLYPVAAIALAATLWRHHRRSQIAGWAALAAGALVVAELADRLGGVFRSAQTGGADAPVAVGTATGAVGEAAAHPLDYLVYLWEGLLPRLPFMVRHFQTTNFAGFSIFVERGWAAFGWYDVLYPHHFYYVILAAMLAVPILGLIAARREWPFVRAHALELAILLLMPLAVFAGFEAAFYTPGSRPAIAEFGRYEFPAIAPLAVLVVASLSGFGRRLIVYAGAVLLVAMIAFSYSGQLLTLTGFYA